MNLSRIAKNVVSISAIKLKNIDDSCHRDRVLTLGAFLLVLEPLSSGNVQLFYRS